MADTRRYVEAVNWAAVREFTVTEDHLELRQSTRDQMAQPQSKIPMCHGDHGSIGSARDAWCS
jgi:hypothetical protein